MGWLYLQSVRSSQICTPHLQRHTSEASHFHTSRICGVRTTCRRRHHRVGLFFSSVVLTACLPLHRTTYLPVTLSLHHVTHLPVTLQHDTNQIFRHLEPRELLLPLPCAPGLPLHYVNYLPVTLPLVATPLHITLQYVSTQSCGRPKQRGWLLLLSHHVNYLLVTLLCVTTHQHISTRLHWIQQAPGTAWASSYSPFLSWSALSCLRLLTCRRTTTRHQSPVRHTSASQFHTSLHNCSGAQNRVGGFFFSLVLVAFPCISAMDLIQPERQVVTREMSRHFYRSVSLLTHSRDRVTCIWRARFRNEVSKVWKLDGEMSQRCTLLIYKSPFCRNTLNASSSTRSYTSSPSCCLVGFCCKQCPLVRISRV